MMVYALLLATIIHILAFLAFQQGFKHELPKSFSRAPSEIQIHLIKESKKEPRVSRIPPTSIVSKPQALSIKKTAPKPTFFSPLLSRKLPSSVSKTSPSVVSAPKLPAVSDQASKPVHAPIEPVTPVKLITAESTNLATAKKALPIEEVETMPPDFKAAYETIPPDFKAAYLNNPKPEYPKFSRRLGEEGTVILAVHVTAEGYPDKVSIHKSSAFSHLDEAARKTVLESWRFIPAKYGNEAVAASVFVPLSFKMSEK